MNYRCQYCDETTQDKNSKAARETCYVSSNGRHKWEDALPDEQVELLDVAMREAYGAD